MWHDKNIQYKWNQRLLFFKFQYQNGKDEKVWNIFLAIRRLQIRTGFRDLKSRQEGLQTGAALGISNRGQKGNIDLKEHINDFKAFTVCFSLQLWWSKRTTWHTEYVNSGNKLYWSTWSLIKTKSAHSPVPGTKNFKTKRK